MKFSEECILGGCGGGAENLPFFVDPAKHLMQSRYLVPVCFLEDCMAGCALICHR